MPGARRAWNISLFSPVDVRLDFRTVETLCRLATALVVWTRQARSGSGWLN